MVLRVTIVGIVRCIYFWRTRNLSNPTINLMPLAYWSCVETLTAIICASLPDSRFFFLRLVPQFYTSVVSPSRKSSSVTRSYWTLGGTSTQSSYRQQQQQGNKKTPMGPAETDTDVEMPAVEVVKTTASV
jgi:hypothetical protein